MRDWLHFVVVTAAALGMGVAAAQTTGRFQDAEEWARRFDDPSRDVWQKPEEVIRALGLPRNAVVADVGAGTGYFAVRLARAVPEGRVYGADLEPQMVRHLRDRAAAESLANLKVVQATAKVRPCPSRWIWFYSSTCRGWSSIRATISAACGNH